MQQFKKDKKKKNHGSGTLALIISNEETEDIMKIVKSLEESGLLIKGISVTIILKQKNIKKELLSVLLRKLAASLLGSALAGKGEIRAGGNF